MQAEYHGVPTSDSKTYAQKPRRSRGRVVHFNDDDIVLSTDENRRTAEECRACFYTPREYRRMHADDSFLVHTYRLRRKHGMEWHDDAYGQSCIRGLESMLEECHHERNDIYYSGHSHHYQNPHDHPRSSKKVHSSLVLQTQRNLRVERGSSRGEDAEKILSDVSEWSSYESKVDAWKLAASDAAFAAPYNAAAVETSERRDEYSSTSQTQHEESLEIPDRHFMSQRQQEHYHLLCKPHHHTSYYRPMSNQVTISVVE